MKPARHGPAAPPLIRPMVMVPKIDRSLENFSDDRAHHEVSA